MKLINSTGILLVIFLHTCQNRHIRLSRAYSKRGPDSVCEVVNRDCGLVISESVGV